MAPAPAAGAVHASAAAAAAARRWLTPLFSSSPLPRQLKREMYFAILLDRATAGPVMIGCSEGGTSIEDLAEK